MDGAPQKFEVIITESAERAYFDILEYLYKHYSETRAAEIAVELAEAPKELAGFPNRGALQPQSRDYKYEYRFILFERHAHATIKIIYFTDELHRKVFVVDFFPTEMHPSKAGRRRDEV